RTVFLDILSYSEYSKLNEEFKNKLPVDKQKLKELDRLDYVNNKYFLNLFSNILILLKKIFKNTH
ncbi:MAG: hypothetical protein ACTSQD_04310, partial [Promethearchaeota archaeon]